MDLDLPMIITQTFLETVEENMFPQRSQSKAMMAAKITISDWVDMHITKGEVLHNIKISF